MEYAHLASKGDVFLPWKYKYTARVLLVPSDLINVVSSGCVVPSHWKGKTEHQLSGALIDVLNHFSDVVETWTFDLHLICL